MIVTKKHTIIGSEDRPFLLDITLDESLKDQPILIFHHGFKGFKDWGHWGLLAEAFAKKGIAFLKFNFSHNGTTADSPTDFTDLEAFGRNNYSKELEDSTRVYQWLLEESSYGDYISLDYIFAIGHSRGGPIALISAERHNMCGAILWASVSELQYAWHLPELVQSWRETGVHYVLNGRTGQQMPMYYQLYEDFVEHEEEWNIRQVLEDTPMPVLLVHGKKDTAVPYQASMALQKYGHDAELELIEDGDHVFGGSHPFTSPDLPPASIQLLDFTADFVQRHAGIASNKQETQDSHRKVKD